VNEATQTLADRLADTSAPHARRAFLRSQDVEGLDLVDLVRAALRRRKDDPPAARRIAVGALLLARAHDRPQAYNAALKMIASIELILGQPRRAERHYTALRARLTPAAAARLGLEYGQVLSMLARFDEALTVIEQSRRHIPRRGSTGFRAPLDIAEGLVHQAQGRSAEALAAYERGRPVLARLGQREALRTLDMNRATTLTNLEAYDKAERLYRRVERQYEAAGVRSMALRAGYNHAYLRFVRGHFHDALHQFRELRAAFEQIGDRRHVAMCDLDEAEISLHMNLPAHAATLAERAAGVLRHLGIKAEVARAEFFGSVAARSLGDFEDARRRMERAEASFRDLDNGMWWGICLHRLAELDLESGHAGRAARRAQKAVALLEDCGLHERAGYAQVLLATIERRSADAARAVARLETLLLSLEDEQLPWLRCEIHHELSHVHATRGDLAGAVRHIQRATRLLEEHRMAVPPDEYMAAFLTGKARLFRDAVRLVLDFGAPGAATRAFELAEQARGRALLDLLRHQTPHGGRGADPHLGRETLRLEREIDGLASRMPSIERGAQAVDAERRQSAVSRREQRLRACLDTLSEQDATSVRLRRGAPPRAHAVQEALTSDETLVEYFFADDELITFVLTADDIRVHRRAVTRDYLQEVLRRMSFQLNHPHLYTHYDDAMVRAAERSANQVLEELAQLLIEPVRAHLTTQRLVIVPHGDLNGVPFHALGPAGSPLLLEHEVVQAPSASIYLHCKQDRGPRAKTALLLGVPDEVAPDIRREVEALKSFVPRHRCFIGREAGVDVLARYGRRARVIHIAAHARFDRDDPMESGVKLGDGWLTIPRIAQLRLRPELLVLAGCATGQVSVTEGGELFGLVRGFLQAGASGMVTSLWPVPDTEATGFMQIFHRALADGQAPAAALRETALRVRAEKPHPFFWSPFVLMGHGGPVVKPSEASNSKASTSKASTSKASTPQASTPQASPN